MNIALIGATGFIGTALLEEALARGHAVTALVRHPAKLADHPQLKAQQVDVADVAALAAHIEGADAVISAFSGHADSDVLGAYLAGFSAIVAAVKKAHVPRLLIVGGAGSLDVAPGLQLIDTPAFPAQYKATAEGARQALGMLRKEAALDWTMLSPSAVIAPGQRTGVFRLGGDQLLLDADGKSAISVQDFAMAMLDEAEQASHRRQRFTVGY